MPSCLDLSFGRLKQWDETSCIPLIYQQGIAAPIT
jgi:hypothetical protein